VLNDKSVTVHNKRKCSKIPPSASMHHATRVRRSRGARRSFLFADRSIQNTSEQFVSCIHLSFYKFRCCIQRHKQKSNEIRSGDSNSSFSVTVQNYTRVHMNFFFSHSNRYCLLPKCWTFLLNHQVFRLHDRTPTLVASAYAAVVTLLTYSVDGMSPI
jgi:hypothetical protein